MNTVIFDLDGTLLYTIEDLAAAVNEALGKCGYPLRTVEEVQAMVGNGIKNLMKKAMDHREEDAAFQKVFETFRSYYTTHCMVKTKPYDGIMELIQALKNQGIKTAIVSNKNQEAVQELAAYFFPNLMEVSMGQSDDMARKPAPDMVFAAMEKMGVTKEEVIYVGDSEVDYETAKNAGIPAVIVTWGFRKKEDLAKLSGVHLIDEPAELLDIINS